jgi:cytochrome c
MAQSVATPLPKWIICGTCGTLTSDGKTATVRWFDPQQAPPLEAFSGRAFIAGRLPNTPDNLIRWIRDPQGVDPGNAMPDVGVTEADAVIRGSPSAG